MATPKEQHDARPGARTVGEGGTRPSHHEAHHEAHHGAHHEAPRRASGQAPDPPRDIRRVDADPDSSDAPNPT